MTKLKIALDMDEVMADLMGAWERWYRYKTGDTEPIDIIEWDVANSFTKMERERVYEFLDIEGVFYNLKPIDGAIVGANQLMDVCDVYFLTAAKSKTAYYEKIEWVREFFGDYYANRVIGVSNGRLKHMIGTLFDVVVDDNPEFLRGIDGSIRVLFTAEHNEHIDYKKYADIRISTWGGLVAWVLRIKDQMEEAKGATTTDLL